MCIYKTNNISFFTFDKCLQSLRNMFIKDYGKEIKYPMFLQDKRMKGFFLAVFGFLADVLAVPFQSLMSSLLC